MAGLTRPWWFVQAKVSWKEVGWGCGMLGIGMWEDCMEACFVAVDLVRSGYYMMGSLGWVQVGVEKPKK